MALFHGRQNHNNYNQKSYAFSLLFLVLFSYSFFSFSFIIYDCVFSILSDFASVVISGCSHNNNNNNNNNNNTGLLTAFPQKIAVDLLIKYKIYSIYIQLEKKYIKSGAEMCVIKKLTNYLTVVKKTLYLEPLNYYPFLRSFIILKVCLEKKEKFVQDLIRGGRELKILDAQS